MNICLLLLGIYLALLLANIFYYFFKLSDWIYCEDYNNTWIGFYPSFYICELCEEENINIIGKIILLILMFLVTWHLQIGVTLVIFIWKGFKIIFKKETK